jgi:hypothetical protein
MTTIEILRDRMRELKFLIGSTAPDAQRAAAREELESLRAQLQKLVAETPKKR